MGKPISLLGEISRKTRTSKSGKSTITAAIKIKSDLIFNPDERGLSLELGEVIVKTLQENLKLGKTGSGISLGPISAKTKEERRNRQRQASAPGHASSRFTTARVRSRIARNFDRRFKSRIGSYTPQGGSVRGFESGMLADSFSMRPLKGGIGWVIFVAAARGKIKPGETESALESVYGNRQIWDARAMAQKHVDLAIQKAVKKTLVNRRSQIASAFKRAFSSAQGFAQEAADLSED